MRITLLAWGAGIDEKRELISVRERSESSRTWDYTVIRNNGTEPLIGVVTADGATQAVDKVKAMLAEGHNA